MKIAGARRAAVMIDHPESDWIDDQWRPERRNGPEHGFVDEPQESELVTSAPSNHESHPSRAGDEWPEHSLGEGSASQMNEISEDTLAKLSRDLHKALLADGGWPAHMRRDARALRSEA